MKKAAIIIVNWNGKKLLRGCLRSLYRQTYKNFDVYFVDNGSVDGSSEYVKRYFSKAKIIQLDKNYGFAGGNNKGIEKSFEDKKVKYIVCLNNDTIVNKNWLKGLIKTAERSKDIGMVSSKAYFPDGKIQNAGMGLERALQVNRFGGHSIGFGKKDYKNLKKEIEIFAPGGVAPLFRREIFEELLKEQGEIFDEDYFNYVEDLDIGFRIRLKGYKAYLSPKAKLTHLHSQTGGIASPSKAYYCERNTVLTALKNLPLSLIMRFYISNLKLKLSYLKKKNKSVERLSSSTSFSKMLLIVLKANLVPLIMLPRFIKKRRKILKGRKVSKKEIKRWFNEFSRERMEG